MAGPKYPLKDFARWKIGEHRYVVDADGKLWAGSPRGWVRIPGTLEEAVTQIKAGTWKYRVDPISNPGARHSAKFDRCVRDVRHSGTAVNAYAVCARTLGQGTYHKGRAKNPLPRPGPIELTAVWTGKDGQEHTVFQRFPTVEKARTAARRLVIAMNRITPHPTRYNIRRRVPFNP